MRKLPQNTPTMTGFLAAVIILVVGTFVSWNLYQTYVEAVTSAELRMMTVARAIGDQFSNDFERIETIIQNLADQISQDLDWPTKSAVEQSTLFNTVGSAVPDIDVVGFVNTDGQLISGGLEDQPFQADVSDREYYIYHQSVPLGDEINPITMTYIEVPRGETTKRHRLYITERVENADGQFMGLVAISLNKDRFIDVFRALDLGEGGAVTLTHFSGVVIESFPPDRSSVGLNIADTAPFRAWMDSGPEEAFSALDANSLQKRLFGYKRLDSLPLVVSASVLEQQILAGFRKDLLAQAAFLLFVTSVSLGVAFYTRALANRASKVEADLIRAQKLESIGQLTGGVAHEFNNILAVILGNAEILTRKAKKIESAGQLERGLDHILRAAQKGKALTSGLLSFSRLQPFDFSLVQVADILDETQQLSSALLRDDTTLNLSAENADAKIFVEPTSLVTALINLIVNAQHALPNGGLIQVLAKTVTIDDPSARGLELEPGEYVVISVVDNGKGIDANLLPKVVDPFFTTKNIGHGTGLGLSIVYGFARQVMGDLRISSIKGKGTRVEIYIPLHLESIEQED